MKKLGIALLIGCVWGFAGCRGVMFVADRVEGDTVVATDTGSDFASDTGSDIVPDTGSDIIPDTGSDIVPDTESGMSTDIDSDTDSAGDLLPCAGISPIPGDVKRTIQVAGVFRSYMLHIPDAHTGDVPKPLLIDYHAMTGTGEGELATSPYPAVTDGEGVVGAFPSGLPGLSGAGWNIGPCCVDDADDVAFTRALIADAAALACIDLSRVYAVGTSMGGGMAHHIACQAADVVAAVAPAAFDLSEQTAADCSPSRPISVISFRGTADPLVPYEGGYSLVVPGHPLTLLGAIATFETWAELNGCTGTPSDLGNGCQSYGVNQCLGGTEVVLCTTEGGGIAPGDPLIAWPFLSSHTLP